MTTLTRRTTTALSVLAGVVAVGLLVFSAVVVYGLTVEYGGLGNDGFLGFGPFVVVPLSAALVAVATWPGARVLPRMLVLGGFVLVLAAALVAASWLGVRGNQARHQAESERFSCSDNAEGMAVDPRLDRGFAALPRPADIYGPVSLARDECEAGIQGGAESFGVVREALLDSGWSVVADEPTLVAVERDGVRAVLFLSGYPGDMAFLRVELIDTHPEIGDPTINDDGSVDAR